MNLSNLKINAIAKGNRGLLLLNKYSPEIFLSVGIGGGLLATGLACGASVKIQPAYKELKKAFDDMEQVKAERGDEYSDKAYSRDRVFVISQFATEVIMLYGPSVALGVISIGMIVGSHRILSKRNAGLIAAYKLVDQAFKSYRNRVKEEFGNEVDTYLRFKKPREGKLAIVDEKKKPVDFNDDEEAGVSYPSMYAVFFDSSSTQWRKDNTLNEFFLRSQEVFFNQELQTRGHVFLNEVYDALGIPRTSAGAQVGWVKNNRDNYISFDIYNPYNSKNRDYINNYNQDSLLLDFNVDGPIFDLI